jgi:hypothetical protein
LHWVQSLGIIKCFRHFKFHLENGTLAKVLFKIISNVKVGLKTLIYKQK